MTWERIEGLETDPRTVPHFDTKFKSHLFNDETTEADVFKALMPISKTGLLKIVRQNVYLWGRLNIYLWGRLKF